MDSALTRRGMRIGELAERLGTTTKTLRFYEQIGLLGTARRSESAYRLYDDEAVQTAQLVLGLRRLGLTLPELQQVLRDDAGSTRRQKLLTLMDEKLRAMYLALRRPRGAPCGAARHAARAPAALCLRRAAATLPLPQDGVIGA